MREPIKYNPNLIEHSINFVVEGDPIGKGRPRVTRQGNFTHTYTPAKTKNYEKLIQNTFLSKYTFNDILHGAIEANIIAYFPIPQSLSKKKQNELLYNYEKHTKKPDIDNVVKTIFDGLNNLAFEDDSNIIKLTAEKLYSNNPRVEIHLKECKYDILKNNTLGRDN